MNTIMAIIISLSTLFTPIGMATDGQVIDYYKPSYGVMVHYKHVEIPSTLERVQGKVTTVLYYDPREVI